MAEPLPKTHTDTAVSPDKVARQKFELERRGFDQQQVRAYLLAVSDSLRDAQTRESEMRMRLGKAIRRAEKAEHSAREATTHDESELTRQLGDEVTTVLDAARAAGEQRITAAQNSADKLLANAKTEATELRRSAETIMDERRADADAAAGEIIKAANAQGLSIVEKAQADADKAKAAAAKRIAQVRNECDDLIREAEEARIQVLEDMDRRRRQARAQVERLRVGRDRLLRSYDGVRRTLDETTSELKTSLQDAKVLGNTAHRRTVSEPLSSRQELEDEMVAARLIGLRPDRPNPTAGASRTPSAPKPDVPNIDMRGVSPGRGKTDTKPASAASARVDPLGAPTPSPMTSKPTTHRAPTPKRPMPGRSTDPSAAAPAPPRPPAVAPTIKSASIVAATDDPPPAPAKPQPSKSAKPTTKGQSAAPKAEATASQAATSPGITLLIDADTIECDDDFIIELRDPHLTIVQACDEIEQVVALTAAELAGAENLVPEIQASAAAVAKMTPAAPRDSQLDKVEEVPQVEAKAGGLFAALRSQAKNDESSKTEAAQALKTGEAHEAEVRAGRHEMAQQRAAVIAESAVQLEKRLKRALADEQNELLAGIRGAKNDPVDLSSLVGDNDHHVQRYVMAIHEIAAVAYSAGAALIDAEPRQGELPAGAVEELIGDHVVQPIRARLDALDAMSGDQPDEHVDAVRAFYRQRKTDHLGEAARSLASLLITAGVCDALPSDSPLPW